MKKITTLLLFVLSCNSFSQSIATALSHDRPFDINSTPSIEKITSYTTYYRKNESEKKKTVSTFNEKNRLRSESRYDKNGKLVARLNFIYDSTQTLSLSRKFETWNNLTGYNSEVAEYVYDSNFFLIKTIDKNSSNEIFRITSLENDKKGNPIKLLLKENNFIGHERAVYDYDKNIVKISILDGSGTKVLNVNEMRINFSERKFEDLTYNEFGDLIKSGKKKYTYKYDKNNNWIKKTNYELVNGKWKKYQVITRNIKYKN